MLCLKVPKVLQFLPLNLSQTFFPKTQMSTAAWHEAGSRRAQVCGKLFNLPAHSVHPMSHIYINGPTHYMHVIIPHSVTQKVIQLCKTAALSFLLPIWILLNSSEHKTKMKLREKAFLKELAKGKWKITCYRQSHIHQLHKPPLQSSFFPFGFCQRTKKGK